MKRRLRTSIFAITIFTLPLLLSSSCGSSRTSFHPDLEAEFMRLSSLSEEEIPAVLADLDREDAIAGYYRDPATKPRVVAFFTELTHSETVARAILENADRTGVPISLVFALAYEESRFEPGAVNDNGWSVDRGVFQLNSKTFPSLTKADFFDPATNARHGIDHLDWCLRTAGNEVAALAMYNAGQGRVSSNGTPRVTLNYIFRILKYQENITSLFAARVAAKGDTRLARLVGRQ